MALWGAGDGGLLLWQGKHRAQVCSIWLVMQEAVRQAPALRPSLRCPLPRRRLQSLHPDRSSILPARKLYIEHFSQG